MSVFGILVLLAWVAVIAITFFERRRAVARGEITLLGHTTYRDSEPSSFRLYLRLKHDVVITIGLSALLLVLMTPGGRDLLSW